MTTDQLKKALATRPFQPFILKMASGDKIEVRHPEFVALSPGGRTVAVAAGDEAFSIIDLLLVERLEVRNNGRRRAG